MEVLLLSQNGTMENRITSRMKIVLRSTSGLMHGMTHFVTNENDIGYVRKQSVSIRVEGIQTVTNPG